MASVFNVKHDYKNSFLTQKEKKKKKVEYSNEIGWKILKRKQLKEEKEEGKKEKKWLEREGIAGK